MYLLMILMNEGTGKFLGETLSITTTDVRRVQDPRTPDREKYKLLVTFSATYSL
jgi:hypothetical protein